MFQHLKKQGHKALAVTLMIALLTVAFQVHFSQPNVAHAAGATQWGTNLELSSLAENKEQTNVVQTSGGNYIAVWQYGDTGPFDMYAAKFDSSGTELWNSEYLMNTTGDQLLEPTSIKLVADDTDHAYFGYIDENNHVVVQKLATSGGGGALSCGTAFQDLNYEYQTMDLLPDGNGGVYITWTRIDTTDIPTIWHTEMVRLDSTCTPYANWNSGNVYDITSMDSAYSDLQAIMSSDGHPIVAYDSAASSAYETFKVDSTLGVATSVLAQVNVTGDAFKMVADNAGGFIAGYLNPAGDTLYTQLYNSSFNPYDFGGGVYEQQIATSATGIESFHATTDGSGGAYFAWNQYDATLTYLTIYAEGISSTGTLWNSGTPVQLTSSTEVSYLENPLPLNEVKPMISDGSNGFYLGFSQSYFGSQKPGVQHVLSDKTLDYSSTGFLLSATSPSMDIPALAFDGVDSVVTVFKDETPQNNVYAQLIGPPTPLTVASIDPTSGIATGGTSVTITGTNFANITDVTFADTSCTNIVTVNDTTITCDTPSRSGIVDVTVTSSTNGSDTLVNGYEYLSGAYVVADAGTSAVNGTYLEGGSFNGQPYYMYNDTYVLYYDGTQYLIDDDGDNTDYYYANQDADTDPLGVYVTGSLGLEPPPTISEYAGGGGVCGPMGDNQACGTVDIESGILSIYVKDGTLTDFIMNPASTGTSETVTYGECFDTVDDDTCGGSDVTYQALAADLPGEAFVGVQDLRAISGATSGWTLTVEQTGFTKDTVNGYQGDADDIPQTNFKVVTTPDVDVSWFPQTPTLNANGLWADANTGALINQITAPLSIATTENGAGENTMSEAAFTTYGTSIGTNASPTTLFTNPATDNPKIGRFGSGVAYQLTIPSGQESGSYQNTVVYTVAPST